MRQLFKSSHYLEYGLVLLFFLSGFSALCYQMVWQRALFATFGINIESVTIIVSLFMFGLGIGALLGARLERYSRHLLHLFVAIELLIAVFGLASRSIIFWLGGLPHIDSLWTIALYSYLVFAVPTLLMGATLPVLMSYINRRVGHTGKSMSMLYASNTFGAAAAAFVTVKVFFVLWGLHTTINIAAGINAATALVAFLLYRGLPDAGLPEVPSGKAASGVDGAIRVSAAGFFFFSFVIGYVALSQELVWYRVLGFLTANHPVLFGLMLACFLIGVAAAAVRSQKAYVSVDVTAHYVVKQLLWMMLIWYAAFPLIQLTTAFAGKAASILLGFLLTGVVAYLCGGVFPILCHLFQERTKESAGRAVGKLYFANVMGATAGPLLTGFVLFEYLSLPATVLLIGLFSAAIIIFFAVRSQLQAGYCRLALQRVFAITIAGIGLHFFGYGLFFETLQLGTMPPKPYDHLNSNRSGVIGVVDTYVFGNGAYDGKMNIDPYNDTNGIGRAYAVTTFHPNPKRILLIGLSGGSWTQVLAFYKDLEQITAIEINKGYLDIIKNYPDHTDLLRNPKVKLVIDDGRRWVRNHPEEKFDVIIMNTIYHWRSNATNLLSKEFLEMCKQRLNPGGYVFINNTGADEVAYTAAHVFDYVTVAFERMVIAGDNTPHVSHDTKIANLLAFSYPDGKPVFKNDAVLAEIANVAFPNQRDTILRKSGLLVVTDDNMATEFKK